MRLDGVAASGGRACAPLLVYRSRALEAAADIAATDGDGPARLERSLVLAAAELRRAVADARTRLGDDGAAIFEVQAAMLDDPEWIDPIRARVAAGAPPEAAVAQVSEALADEIRAIPDEYLQQRGTDVLDLAQRLLRLLGVPSAVSLSDRIGDAASVVVAAYDLTPSDTLALAPDVVKAIVTETGGRTSHTAILARQLGIPAVMGVAGLLDAARDGLLAAVDGDDGFCELDPPRDVVRRFSAAPVAANELMRSEPVATLDGAEVHVLANAASPDDVRRALTAGADGIGLYRTEFLFLGAQTLPDESAQAAVYAEAAEAAQGRPIVFRTLDVGGDKDAPLLGLEREQNPFLGVRGVRFSLANPELFEIQLRALVRTARAFPNVRVMVPMVTTVDELERVRALCPEAPFPLGAMIEVPAAAVLASEFAASADFLSVGTNDLTQYLLAVDRTNERLASLYDELNPAVLRVLGSIATAAAASGTEVGVCGELAGRPEVAPLLLGLGYRHLSVVPPKVQDVKRAVAGQTVQAAVALAERACAATRPADVARLLT